MAVLATPTHRLSFLVISIRHENLLLQAIAQHRERRTAAAAAARDSAASEAVAKAAAPKRPPSPTQDEDDEVEGGDDARGRDRSAATKIFRGR